MFNYLFNPDTIQNFLILLGIIFALVEVNKIQEQNYIQIVIEYTRRYADILKNFPLKAFQNETGLDDLNPKDREIFLKNLRTYIDLCSEEYLLYKKKFIDKELWKDWEKGLKSNFELRCFREGWKELKYFVKYYPEFSALLNKLDIF